MFYLSEREKAIAETSAALASELQNVAALLIQDAPLDLATIQSLNEAREQARKLSNDYKCHYCQTVFNPAHTEHVITTTHSIVHSDGTVIRSVGDPARMAICAKCWGKTSG